MCFVEEKCETILCDVREEKKLELGLSRPFGFLVSIVHRSDGNVFYTLELKCSDTLGQYAEHY